MKNRTIIVFGSVLILIGLFSIIESLTKINLWAILFPILLILVGIFLILRPNFIFEDSNFVFRFVNETKKNEPWMVKSTETLAFVSETVLDFSQAIIPEGDTKIRFNSFVNEIDIVLPSDAGLKISAWGIVKEVKVNGQKEDQLFVPFDYQTPDYDSQTKKISIEIFSFVASIKVK